MNKILAVVPARMDSSRFPGKPLENINGIPMIAHCYFRATLAKNITKVVLATPDQEIINFGKKYNIETILTSNKHERATERAEEVLQILKKDNEDYDYVLLLQGDEPQIDPEEVDRLALALFESSNQVVNLIHPIHNEDMKNPNVVKVIKDINNNIIFFSRSSIPYGANSGFRQLGMIGFTSKILETYCELAPTDLEILESIDMMRFLENDIKISALTSYEEIIGVDNPPDIKKVEEMMKDDSLLVSYEHLFK
tara:strand:- start:316 stop:1074 length:759 start_codon:yes stop_codon:yes gene_type:complete